MTENEAIEKLNMLDEALNFPRSDADECSRALQMAMHVFEEIQLYREIGTIEELENLKKNRLTFSIKVSENTLQKIVGEKIKECEANIEYNVKKIRNEVIDDIIKILKKHNVPFHGAANYEILQLKEGRLI